MKVVSVAHAVPYEGVRHAGGQFLLEHLRHLSHHCEVELLLPGSPDVVADIDRAPDWLSVTVAPFVTEPSGVARLPMAMRRRVRFRSLSVPAIRGLMQAGLPELASSADVLELQWTDTAVLASLLRARGVDVAMSLVAHDVTFLSIPGQHQLATSPRAGPAQILADRVRARVERFDLELVDLVLVFKQDDAESLHEHGVSTPTLVVEPSIEFPTGVALDPTPGAVLFTGAMWRPENQSGVTWFVDQVWPEVLKREGSAWCTVAGEAPPEDFVAHVTAVPQVTVTGGVDDLASTYASASVFVAPLFAPGGIKFKVPQAMAHGLPVVATPVAVAGLGAPPQVLWEVTDDPLAMADAVVRAIRDPGAALECGRVAAEWVRTRFSFSASTARVASRYRQLAEARDGSPG